MLPVIIFFTQIRCGKFGKPFKMYKFRTMYPGAEKDQIKFQHLNQGIPPTFKIRDDPRLTPIGRFLSNTGLDELPQFYNVLTGDMALFGPRPLPIKEAQKIPKKWRYIREAVKPGIISSWIFEGGHNLSQKEWMLLDQRDVKNLCFFSYKLKLAGNIIKFIFNQFFILLRIKQFDFTPLKNY